MFLTWENKGYTIVLLVSFPHRSSFSLLSQLIMTAFEETNAMK